MTRQRNKSWGGWDEYQTTIGREGIRSKISGNKMQQKKKVRVSYDNDLLRNKPPREGNKIIQGHIPSAKGDPRETLTHIVEDTPTEKCNIGRWILPCDLLDDGQGESSSLDMDISNSRGSNGEDTPPPTKHTTTNGAQLGTEKGNKLLLPPIIEKMGKGTTGATPHILCKQNKIHRNKALANQAIATQWITNNGKILMQTNHWEGRLNTLAQAEMIQKSLVLQHKAAHPLTDWEKFGCPTMSERDWTLEQIQAAINQGPHQLALKPEAIAHFEEEVRDKVAKGQACVILWDDIKENCLPQLKVSLVVAIPHKLCAYRSILDLLFALRLEDGGMIESVNNTAEKLAPQGAINQLGHSLKQIFHTFAEVDNNAKILVAKWDIHCCKGEEWSFCYVWPQAPDKPKCLVIPSLLQMGWVKSAPYFCAALETAQDVIVQYVKTRIGSLLHHKFKEWAGANVAEVNEPRLGRTLCYLLEVYADDVIALIVPTSRVQVVYTWQGGSPRNT